MGNFLDKTGLSTLWAKMKETFATKSDVSNIIKVVECDECTIGNAGGSDYSKSFIYLFPNANISTYTDGQPVKLIDLRINAFGSDNYYNLVGTYFKDYEKEQTRILIPNIFINNIEYEIEAYLISATQLRVSITRKKASIQEIDFEGIEISHTGNNHEYTELYHEAASNPLLQYNQDIGPFLLKNILLDSHFDGQKISLLGTLHYDQCNGTYQFLTNDFIYYGSDRYNVSIYWDDGEDILYFDFYNDNNNQGLHFEKGDFLLGSDYVANELIYAPASSLILASQQNDRQLITIDENEHLVLYNTHIYARDLDNDGNYFTIEFPDYKYLLFGDGIVHDGFEASLPTCTYYNNDNDASLFTIGQDAFTLYNPHLNGGTIIDYGNYILGGDIWGNELIYAPTGSTILVENGDENALIVVDDSGKLILNNAEVNVPYCSGMYSSSGSCFGFNDEGVPTFLNTTDELVLAGGYDDTLDNYYYYHFPAKDGTVALTSDLDSYLTKSAASTTYATKTSVDSKTNTSVLPNDNGEIKTKFRIAQKGYTGGSSNVWYYKLCEFPVDNTGNYAGAIVSGRIGGWTNDNMSYLNALLWNRNGVGISLIDIAGGASSMSTIWNTCDLAIYKETDNSATVYIKCTNYFTFDLDIKMYQSTASIIYDGTYTTSPSGTLSALASTSNKRLELINGKLQINGTELATKSELPTKTSQLSNDSGFLTDITKTQVTNALGYTPPTSDTDTHRSINVNGTTVSGLNGTKSAVNFKAGSNVTITGSGTDITIDATNTTYSQATASTAGLVKIGYTESGKNYPVELNSSGQMYVNVPWTDNNTTYDGATASKLGLIKVSSVNSSAVTVNSESTTSGRYYPIELNSDGKAIVNVPWTDTDTTYSAATTSTAGLMSAADKSKLDGIAANANNYTYTLPLAASGTRGGIKIGYTASGANIPVQLSSEKAYVALTKTAVTTALGYTPPTTNTTYDKMTNSNLGLGKPANFYYNSTATYNGGSFSSSPCDTSAAQTININTVTNTAGRYYGVEADKEGRLFVNVPWTSGGVTQATMEQYVETALSDFKADEIPTYYQHTITLTGSSFIAVFTVMSKSSTSMSASQLYTQYPNFPFAATGYIGNNVIMKLAFTSASQVRLVYGSSATTGVLAITDVADSVVTVQ